MKPITDVMREIRKGETVEAATEALAEVVRACRATGKPGSITVKVTITPQGVGEREMKVAASVTNSVPKPALRPAVFYAGDEGDLHRNDPDQGQLALTEVGGGKAAATPETEKKKA